MLRRVEIKDLELKMNEVTLVHIAIVMAFCGLGLAIANKNKASKNTLPQQSNMGAL